MRVLFKTNLTGAALTASVLLAANGVAASQQDSDRASPVTDQRLVQAIHDDANWLSYGKDYSDTRFSPLQQINDQSVRQLGLAWSQDINSPYASKATPLVIDGVCTLHCRATLSGH